MAEYIFEINDVLLNEETGKAVMKPEVKGELIRCKDCKHWDGVDTCDVIDAPVWDNDFCSLAERRSHE